MWIEQQQISKKTRMHSSRMRTAYFNGHIEGVCLWVQGVWVWVRGVSASGSGGVFPLGPGGVCLWIQGASLGRDPPQGRHPVGQTPPGRYPLWVNTPRQIPSWDRQPWQTPHGQTPHGQTPPAPLHTGINPL